MFVAAPRSESPCCLKVQSWRVDEGVCSGLDRSYQTCSRDA